MPTYVYKFLETGETLEVQQSFSDPTLTEAVHPVSGVTMAVKKVFQPVGVTFKGSGFYKTDSRNGSKKSSSGTSTSDAGSSTSGSDSSSSTSTASSDSSASSSPTPAASTASSSD